MHLPADRGPIGRGPAGVVSLLHPPFCQAVLLSARPAVGMTLPVDSLLMHGARDLMIKTQERILALMHISNVVFKSLDSSQMTNAW